MHQFKDKQGREWFLSMSIGQARKLKEDLELDVLDGGASLQKLATDPYTTANVLYVLCEEQAKKAEVSEEQFGESLAGDVIDDATEALLAELVDFFPKRQREALRTMLAKLSDVQDEAATMAGEKINGEPMEQMIQTNLKATALEIDAMIQKETQKAQEKLLAGSSSGNAPALSVTA